MNTLDVKALSRAFGARLASTRHASQLTQQQLADALTLTSSETVSRYERGEREPRLSTIFRLATALGVTPAELIDLERAPAEPSPNERAGVEAQIAASAGEERPVLSPGELWLLHAFRSAAVEEQAMILRVVDAIRGDE